MNDFGEDRIAECIPGCRLSLLKRIFKRILGLSANTYTHVCASSDCTMCVLFYFLVALYLNALVSLFCAHPTKPTQLECDHICFQSGMEIRPRATCIVAFCAGPICGRWEDERLTNNGSVLSCFSSVPTYVGVW